MQWTLADVPNELCKEHRLQHFWLKWKAKINNKKKKQGSINNRKNMPLNINKLDVWVSMNKP